MKRPFIRVIPRLDIKNGHLNLEESRKLIKKYGGEFPDNYPMDVLKYLRTSKNKFYKLQDTFRSPHLWKKKGKNWFLRHTANNDGVDDKKN